MGIEINTPNQQQSQTPIGPGTGVNVMVVDDDVVCLAIVAGILRSWKYQVVTAKNPLDALATLRLEPDFFHLVVTDVHMPEMNGFEFQKIVQEEFHLPVVMMSADDKESSMLRGLQAGASFYLVKPVNYNDLKNMWQYASSNDKPADDDQVGAGGAAGPVEEPPADHQEPPVEDTPVNNDPIVIETVQYAVNKLRKEPKRRASKRVVKDNGDEDGGAGGGGGGGGHEDGNDNNGGGSGGGGGSGSGSGGGGEAIARKRTKIVWTTPLHNRFLDAVRKIGIERAVPKRILELMNTPGLSRENIASHLQKYRLFLRRVAEASNSTGTYKGKTMVERTLRSSFATGHPTLLLSALQKGYPELLSQQAVGSILLHQGVPENFQLVDDPSLSAAVLANHQASASTSTNIPAIQPGPAGVHPAPMNNSQACPQQQQSPGNNSTALPEEAENRAAGRMIRRRAQRRSNPSPRSTPPENNIIHGVHHLGFSSNQPLNLGCPSGVAGSNHLGFGSTNEVSAAGFNGNRCSITGNRNLSPSAAVAAAVAAAAGNANSRHCTPGASSSVGFSPRFYNVSQQIINNNDMMLRTPPLVQQDDSMNGGESSGYLLDHLMDTTVPMEGVSPLQFGESDIDEMFRGHFNNVLNINEQQTEEEVQSHANNSNPMENPTENQQPSKQIGSSGDHNQLMGISGVEQLDEYFMNYEPHNHNQQQGGGVYQQPVAYNGYPSMSPARSQDMISDEEFLDSVFGPGKF